MDTAAHHRPTLLVTGASSGIGKACALLMDRLGWRVFAGVRRLEDGESLRSQASPNLIPLILDITSTSNIQQAISSIQSVVGNRGLAGLVNNAGIAVAAPLEFIPIAEFREQLEVNLISQLAVTQACIPLLRQGRGRIVLVSSISGLVATPFLAPYAISKFGLEAMADALRRELMPWDIAVSVVEPGRINTPIWGKSLQHAENLLKRLPPEAEFHYGKAIARNLTRAERARGGTSVEVVAHKIAHALTTRRPRIRYQVGMDARFGAWLSHWVPDWLLDRLIAIQRGTG